MHKTVFSREMRLLLCPQCGAPIEGAIEGGALSCRYCGASSPLRPRDESREAAKAAAPPAMSEAERFQRLREQHVPPPVPPPSLAYLCIDGWLPPANVPQGFAEFQSARQELAAGGAFGAAERLFFLAMVLYEHLAFEHKDAEVRALLETARDVLSDPVHRQVIHGMLARNAARAGDPAAAEGWLHLMDPRSTHLHMETAYVLSRAYVSTREGDFASVLRTLGSRVGDVPLAENYDLLCGLLRANALERTGNEPTAVQQLGQVAAAHPSGIGWLQRMAAGNSELGLCPQSLAALQGRSF
jgi:hypothetical protein